MQTTESSESIFIFTSKRLSLKDTLSFDLITIVVKNKIKGIVSQNCTDIDGIAAGTGTVARKRTMSTSARGRLQLSPF